MARYDIEANSRLAIWKQKMMTVKPLVYALIVEDKAKKRGLSVETQIAAQSYLFWWKYHQRMNKK